MRPVASRCLVGMPVIVVTVAVLAVPAARAGTSPAERCQATRNTVVGKYAACRQQTEAKRVTTGDAAGHAEGVAKCVTKLIAAWQRASERASASGATCLDAPLTVDDFRTAVDAHAETMRSALAGAGFSGCSADLATCESSLEACSGDLDACSAARDTCEASLDGCESDLALCESTMCGNGTIEGAEECDRNAFGGETCVTQGFALGTLYCEPGCRIDTTFCYPARFWDVDDNSVVDLELGVEWEKKSSPGWGGGPTDPHDLSNTYTWGDLAGCAFVGCPNGTAFTDFLGRLNGCRSRVSTPNAIYGSCGWRLPTLYELTSIVDHEASGCGTYPNTCIDPIFGPTSPDGVYASSSTDDDAEDRVLGVHFSTGVVASVQKAVSMLVRAVRRGGVAFAV